MVRLCDNTVASELLTEESDVSVGSPVRLRVGATARVGSELATNNWLIFIIVIRLFRMSATHRKKFRIIFNFAQVFVSIRAWER